jgi:hypothetical protein
VQQLDRARGEALKREGQQLALSFAGDDWRDRVLSELEAWLAVEKARGTKTFTFEQFRSQAKAHPERHQSWGALATLACKRGLTAPALDQYGEQRTVKAASAKTHSHRICVWLVL